MGKGPEKAVTYTHIHTHVLPENQKNLHIGTDRGVPCFTIPSAAS